MASIGGLNSEEAESVRGQVARVERLPHGTFDQPGQTGGGLETVSERRPDGNYGIPKEVVVYCVFRWLNFICLW